MRFVWVAALLLVAGCDSPGMTSRGAHHPAAPAQPPVTNTPRDEPRNEAGPPRTTTRSAPQSRPSQKTAPASTAPASTGTVTSPNALPPPPPPPPT